jgi:4-amino-4-deoxy-L-arabinose transferase-like glycosyltransferase
MNQKIERIILWTILFVALLTRLTGLNWGDPISDEGTNAFRSLGLIDFDAAAAQPTPWEWAHPNLPWWIYLSLHDHPMLTFIFESVSMAFFGESPFGFRLPSALFGVGAIYLIYLIGKRLFGSRAGLISAAIAAVSVNHVYVSRIGLQESPVIFLILLTLYFVLRAEDDPRYLIWAGAALGFGLMAKYTAAIALFIALPYLTIVRPKYFREPQLYIGTLLALLIFSPSIIYNLMLYKTFGHFDFQISHILGNYPPAWAIAPGKDIGTLGERLALLPKNILMTNSWLVLLLFGAALLYAAIKGLTTGFWRRYLFLGLGTALTLLLILKIGPSYRFLTMMFPWIALWVGAFLAAIKWWWLVVPVAAFEIFYTANSQIIWYPAGSVPWAFSNVRYENYNWGYNELGQFFKHELQDKYPALIFDVKYKFLEKLRDESVERARRRGYSPYPALIIYEGDFDTAAKLWNLDRLQVYHGWPLKSYAEFAETRKNLGSDYFDKLGFREYYLVVSGASVPMPEFYEFVAGKSFTPILNKRGEEAFRVYRF